MVWANFDDNYPEHPKVWGLTDGAFRLHASMVCTSTRLLTDGLIDRSRLVGLVPKYRPKQLAELVSRGLVHETGHLCDRCPQPSPEAVVLHDFHETNRTAEQVKANRAATKERQRKYREKKDGHAVSNGARNGVTNAAHSTPLRPEGSGVDGCSTSVRGWVDDPEVPDDLEARRQILERQRRERGAESA